MSNAEAAQRVKAGYRLSQPEGCPDYIFRIMLSCWETKPDDRPTFKQLLKWLTNDENSEAMETPQVTVQSIAL